MERERRSYEEVTEADCIFFETTFGVLFSRIRKVSRFSFFKITQIGKSFINFSNALWGLRLKNSVFI